MANLCGPVHIQLHKVNKGDFWKLTGFSFHTLQQHLHSKLPDSCHYWLTWQNSGNVKLQLSYINDRYIGFKIEDCVEFVMSKNKYQEIKVNNVTTNCRVKVIHKGSNSNTRFLMETLDKIASLFGVHRIYLEDAAKTSVRKTQLDFTLTTVMSENKTFYEKYGYQICVDNKQQQPDIQIHKRLLRDFDFHVFFNSLTPKHRSHVQRVLNHLMSTEKNYKRLCHFYNDANEHLTNTGNDKYLLRLQTILQDNSYPWYAMVDVIQSLKTCMERFF